MATGSRERYCSNPKCNELLVNANGVHMGIPFGKWQQTTGHSGVWRSLIMCAKCYDEVTVKDNVQRTGEEVI
jgi:hypothetical protein